MTTKTITDKENAATTEHLFPSALPHQPHYRKIAGQPADHVGHRPSPHIEITAVELQGRIAEDLHQTVGHGHRKSRQPQRQNLLHQLPPQAQIGYPQTQYRLLLAKKSQHPYHGHKL